MIINGTRDWLIYLAHGLFWAAFGIARLKLVRGRARVDDPAASGGAAATGTTTAPYSRALLAVHSIAFGLMYFGIAAAVFGGGVPDWFAGQRVTGALVIAIGGAIACWAVASFESWRLRAQLDAGHRLATGGAFRLVRHPIYLALNLLALGSALWIPAPLLWVAFVGMCIGSDLRARAEEKLLHAAFGATYDDYCARTKRFVPGVY